jgi:hypothetical protein
LAHGLVGGHLDLLTTFEAGTGDMEAQSSAVNRIGATSPPYPPSRRSLATRVGNFCQPAD